MTRNRRRSTQRLEKPHSLSYHDNTFTKSPSITFVFGASTIDELGLPRKSIETSSSVDIARMPFIGPLAAAVSAALKEAAEGSMKGILGYSTEELVSIDFKGNPNSSIVDSPYTKVMDGDFVKVLSWYDNEWGYSSRCVDLLRFLVTKGL